MTVKKVKGKRVLKNGAVAGYVLQRDGSYKWRIISGPKKGGMKKGNNNKSLNKGKNKLKVFKFYKEGELTGHLHTRNVYFNSKTNKSNPAIVYTSKGFGGRVKESRININNIRGIKITKNELNTKPLPSNLIKIEFMMNNSKPKIFSYIETMNKPSDVVDFIEELGNINPHINITGNYLSNVTQNELNSLFEVNASKNQPIQLATTKMNNNNNIDMFIGNINRNRIRKQCKMDGYLTFTPEHIEYLIDLRTLKNTHFGSLNLNKGKKQILQEIKKQLDKKSKGQIRYMYNLMTEIEDSKNYDDHNELYKIFLNNLERLIKEQRISMCILNTFVGFILTETSGNLKQNIRNQSRLKSAIKAIHTLEGIDPNKYSFKTF